MIDKSALLALFDHNEQLVSRVIAIFRQEAPVLLELLGNAVLANEVEAITLHAHSLKSLCAYLGLSEMQQLCRQLEEQPNVDLLPRWKKLSEGLGEILKEGA